jgi:hypothetical protein
MRASVGIGPPSSAEAGVGFAVTWLAPSLATPTQRRGVMPWTCAVAELAGISATPPTTASAAISPLIRFRTELSTSTRIIAPSLFRCIPTRVLRASATVGLGDQIGEDRVDRVFKGKAARCLRCWLRSRAPRSRFSSDIGHAISRGYSRTAAFHAKAPLLVQSGYSDSPAASRGAASSDRLLDLESFSVWPRVSPDTGLTTRCSPAMSMPLIPGPLRLCGQLLREGCPKVIEERMLLNHPCHAPGQ